MLATEPPFSGLVGSRTRVRNVLLLCVYDAYPNFAPVLIRGRHEARRPLPFRTPRGALRFPVLPSTSSSDRLSAPAEVRPGFLPNSMTPTRRVLGGLSSSTASGRDCGRSVAVIVRSYVWSAFYPANRPTGARSTVVEHHVETVSSPRFEATPNLREKQLLLVAGPDCHRSSMGARRFPPNPLPTLTPPKDLSQPPSLRLFSPRLHPSHSSGISRVCLHRLLDLCGSHTPLLSTDLQSDWKASSHEVRVLT